MAIYKLEVHYQRKYWTDYAHDWRNTANKPISVTVPAEDFKGAKVAAEILLEPLPNLHDWRYGFTVVSVEQYEEDK